MPQAGSIHGSKDKFEILIVDDDNVVRLLHKKILEHLNHPISCFANGREAMRYIEENDSDTNFLVFLDINMPIMDGWEFLEECEKKSFAKNLHIIMVSSSINPKDKERAFIFTGVIAYQEKPFKRAVVQEISELKEINRFFDITGAPAPIG